MRVLRGEGAGRHRFVGEAASGRPAARLGAGFLATGAVGWGKLVGRIREQLADADAAVAATDYSAWPGARPAALM